LATEKIVVFAPIASASETAATSVKPGLLRSRRAANTRSGGSQASIGIIYPKTSSMTVVDFSRNSSDVESLTMTRPGRSKLAE
jgi:hypothetical protein